MRNGIHAYQIAHAWNFTLIILHKHNNHFNVILVEKKNLLKHFHYSIAEKTAT